MHVVRYVIGWFVYRVKAGWWYFCLALKLWFAIGLDRDFDHTKDDEAVAREFSYPGKKEYRRHLNRPVE
ncbi:hypothetical protein [Acanthopleuribacter pedis]|uniref:Uncharacterized protein n=1 Tax=Acanthopleuribacter pedis TaxID=442870 RepID=A0A8J7Q9U1_9BACT|nr:hypothetical protein [Acanthopleuribacter pedis]MBO1320520.1 hypothetical protein [Acanthopleuribacter pedis]